MQEGQIFALVVMVVAACEVVVGLGLIVAMFRRRLPLNVDDMRELRGMNAVDYGWLILAFPLAGSLIIGIGWRALPGRAAGWIATAAIGLAFASSVAVFIDMLGLPTEERQLVSSLYDYATAAGVDIQLDILVDPSRSSCAWW